MAVPQYIIEKININKIEISDEVSEWAHAPNNKLVHWKTQIGFPPESVVKNPQKVVLLTIALLERVSDKKLYATININTVFKLAEDVKPADRKELLLHFTEVGVTHLQGVSSQALEHTVMKHQLPQPDDSSSGQSIQAFLQQFWN